MVIFPVRHHSPAAARQLDRLIRERRPRVVLIEGPSDADRLIPFLLDSATVPPVAIYAYPATSQEQPGISSLTSRGRSVFYPLCHYSPELIALRTGDEVGAQVRFCDIPATVSLVWEHQPEVGESGDPDAAVNGDGSADHYGDYVSRLATAAGFDSFDAFWETIYEQGCSRASLDDFITAYTGYGERARGFAELHGHGERDDLRERHMAGVALSIVESGIAADEIVLVCGAAHASAIAAYVANGVTLPDLVDGIETELALVPYSYPRLSEQLGYGAGNRAPWFYQQVWRGNGDYAAASRTTVIEVAQRLRRRGQIASLAQEIDANELATVLAGMRGKFAPGVDEVTDAAVACFGQGNAAVVTEALRDVLIGHELGQVTPFAGRTPLQTEFYATAQRLGLPVVDAPRQVLVHLPMPVEAAQSVFLHRLVASEIPFGRELQSGIGGGGRIAQGGPLAGLGRAREKWELCWTPATDTGLVERNAWGSTLAEVCTRFLRNQLSAATRIDEGTGVLLQLALCDLPDPFPAALQRCETLAADSGSFPALARSVYHLDGLLSYGAARQLPREELADLAGRLFVRAMLHLAAAINCADEAAADVEQTLTPLAELVRKGSPTAAPDLFWETIESVAAIEGCHPSLRGLALTLLEVEGRLPPGELARRLRRWLSVADPAANARLVAGVFSLHRGTLIRNRSLLTAVTDFLMELEIEALIPLLPALRRSLGNLSRSERSYLAEALAGVLGLDHAPPLSLNLSDVERAIVREADSAVAATLAGWKERYGIG
jgi:hypothetical protein